MYLKKILNATVPLIALEEHYLAPNISYSGITDAQRAQLLSLGNDRLNSMDQNNIAMQVLSHVPIILPPQPCTEINNALHETVIDEPSRFAPFALIPVAEPEAAASELRRCIKDLDFVGTLIPNNDNGAFYDDRKYWPMFATAEKLDVPIYLHPMFPAEPLAQHYNGNFSQNAVDSMATASWGWHSETGLHFLRLFAAGLFDEYPKLKIVLGHMGEMVPYMLDRIIPMSGQWGPLDRNLTTVWKENIWVTTSGMFSLEPFKCLLGTVAKDRILFSVDYPFAPNEGGSKFIKDIVNSGLMDAETLEAFAHGNAKKLLKLNVTV